MLINEIPRGVVDPAALAMDASEVVAWMAVQRPEQWSIDDMPNLIPRRQTWVEASPPKRDWSASLTHFGAYFVESSDEERAEYRRNLTRSTLAGNDQRDHEVARRLEHLVSAELWTRSVEVRGGAGVAHEQRVVRRVLCLDGAGHVLAQADTVDDKVAARLMGKHGWTRPQAAASVANLMGEAWAMLLFASSLLNWTGLNIEVVEPTRAMRKQAERAAAALPHTYFRPRWDEVLTVLTLEGRLPTEGLKGAVRNCRDRWTVDQGAMVRAQILKP